MTVAERQRRRRQRLREKDEAEVMVQVPVAARDRVRRIARALRDGWPVSPRLIRALQVLRAERAALAELGVERAGIFGSVARGEEGPESDIDVLLVMTQKPLEDAFQLVHVRRHVAEAMGAVFPGIEIDVSTDRTLKPFVRANVEAEAVYAY